MTLLTSGLDLDRPFQRWRLAVAAFADAEKRNPYGLEADRLATDVIVARLELTRVRVADGWTSPDVKRDRLDAVLLEECAGAIERVIESLGRDELRIPVEVLSTEV